MTAWDRNWVGRGVGKRNALVREDDASGAEIRKQLYAVVERFIIDNGIHCPETIYQMDHVIGNAYDFIEEVCNIVGYASLEEADERDCIDED